MYQDDHSKAMELRKKLQERVGELQTRVQETSSEAFERVFYMRMDTYFAQQERLEEMEQLLEDLSKEVNSVHELDGLKRLSDRLNFVEDHFEDIDGKMYDRPVRRRHGRFNLFEFLHGSSDGPRGEISSEAEALRELGLESGTSLKSVKAAFRKLVKELHPDKRGGDRSAEPRLRRLVAAYQFLKRKMGAHPSSSR